MKKTNEKVENSTSLVAAPSAESLAALADSFPAEEGYNKIYLPRLEYVSQDKMSGEGKDKKCVVEAGTYFSSKEGEKDKEGKITWVKTELGQEIEASIVYQRKQLKYWDKTVEAWASTPIYDQDTDVLPLFFQGVKIREGTPEELKKMYEYKDEEGKIKTKMEDNKVLYVLFQKELYQFNLRGSSMFSFKTFARKTTLIPAQLTRFYADPSRTQGSNTWRPANFSKIRDLNSEEIALVQAHMNDIKKAISDEARFYAREKKLENTAISYPVAEVEGISADKIPF